MIVVGIDSSLTVSGCARVTVGAGESGQLEALSWETWRGRAPKPDEETTLTTRRRLRVMIREVLALVPAKVDLTVIEGPSLGRHTGMADERAALRWFLIDQLLARGPVAVIAPKTRALLATDNGNADKRAVLAAIRPLVPAANVPDHNVADAVALALAGAHRLGMPWPAPMSKKQQLAHGKVPWPQELAVA